MSPVGPRLPGLQAVLPRCCLMQDERGPPLASLGWAVVWGGGVLILGKAGFHCPFDPLVALLQVGATDSGAPSTFHGVHL